MKQPAKSTSKPQNNRNLLELIKSLLIPKKFDWHSLIYGIILTALFNSIYNWGNLQIFSPDIHIVFNRIYLNTSINNNVNAIYNFYDGNIDYAYIVGNPYNKSFQMPFLEFPNPKIFSSLQKLFTK